MPIYEYECANCKNRFEYRQSMSEPPMTVCESCGGALTKVISPSGFILKGGGWYKDLYGNKKSGGEGGESK
jgi:putative FmdB family regulatory protein